MPMMLLMFLEAPKKDGSMNLKGFENARVGRRGEAE